MESLPTFYDGYRFRSRLEARWAVFFHTLKIDYRYEPDGYDLEGTWYLPDFWLPEQDCWIEVKPYTPTEAECEKARLLALHSGKEVYILAGNVGLPPRYQAWRWVPPRVYAFPQGGSLGKEAYQPVEKPLVEFTRKPELACPWHGCRNKQVESADKEFVWQKGKG